MEEQLRSTEIDQLSKIQDSINDNSIGSNPMFDFIEQIETLKNFCNKKMNKPSEVDE